MLMDHKQGKVGEKRKTIPTRMSYLAGYREFHEWTSGENHHAGIGQFEPFGQSEYVCGVDFDEAKDYPIPEIFSAWWQKNFDTSQMCVYRMKDGDLYAYDGVFGALIEGTEDLPPDVPVHRNDAIINVIVGGTGTYEGALGLMIGRTEGSGEIRNASNGTPLPTVLLKLMEGYISLPVKEENNRV